MSAKAKDWTIKVSKQEICPPFFDYVNTGYSEESFPFSGTETEAEVEMWKLRDKANDHLTNYDFIAVELYEKGHEDDLNPIKSLWARDEDYKDEYKPFEDISELKSLLFRLQEEKARQTS